MVVEFRYPLQPSPLVAVIDPRHRCGPLNLGRFDTIAAPLHVLLELPAYGWRPGYPVVAFTGLGCGFLTDRDRDLLWRRLRVPVFEQLLSPSYEVIAEECDAHDGLHLRSAPALGCDFLAEIVSTRCECGLTSPRLMNVRSAEISAICA